MTTPGSFSAVEIPRACLFNSYELAITELSSLVISCILHLDSLKARPTADDQEARFLQSAAAAAMKFVLSNGGFKNLSVISKGGNSHTRETV